MGQYTLFDSKITFENCNENFFDLQHQLRTTLEKAASDFTLWYSKREKILTVLENYQDEAYKLVVKYANEPLFKQLPLLEIYDISESNYDDNCFTLENSVSALEKVAEAYNEIIAQQDAEEAYRAERKAYRGRVVGGGFGLGGAVKGMATAGAMNAISGAGHSLVNAVGNIGSAINAASSKKALYENKSVKEILKNGICNDITACFNAHLQLVNSRKGRHFISCFDEDKSGALFQNAKTVPEKRIKLLTEAFTNCPWNKDLLEYIFLNYKAERKNIWDIANRYNIDLKQTAEKAFSIMYTPSAKKSEEEAQIIKQDILAQMKMLGIVESDTINTIERDGVHRLLAAYDGASETQKQIIFSKLDEYDAQEKIKASVIHEKQIWEIARKYHVKFTQDEIESILRPIYTDEAKSNEEAAQVAKKKIKTIMSALSVSNSKVLNTLESDCLARLCPDYQTATEASCNEMLKRIEAYKALQQNKKPYIDKIQSRIEAIWSAEDNEIFDNVYLNTDIENPDEIQKSINYITAKHRTSSALQYLHALHNCTPDKIKKARQFQHPTTNFAKLIGIASILLGIVFLFVGSGFLLSLAIAAIGIALLVYRNNLKKSWDILTLNGSLVHSKISLDGQEHRSAKSHAESALERD